MAGPLVAYGDSDEESDAGQPTVEATTAAQVTDHALQESRQSAPTDPYQALLQRKVDEWATLPPGTDTITSALLKHRQFQNPNIVTKLISYLQIQEYDSMLPLSQWDPSGVAGEEGLGWADRLEKASTERSEQRQSNRSQIPFVPSHQEDKKESRRSTASQGNADHRSHHHASSRSNHDARPSSASSDRQQLASKIGAGAMERIESLARDRHRHSHRR